MFREILIYPDPRLRQVAKLVTIFDSKLRMLVEDMIETMYAAGGIGLAATQIGVPARVIVIERGATQDAAAVVMALVNPVIHVARAQQDSDEGCLSLPGERFMVRRPKEVVVSAQDVTGEPIDFFTAEGFYVTQLVHEIEHLDGKLAVDYAGPVKRGLVERRLRKAVRHGAGYARKPEA